MSSSATFRFTGTGADSLYRSICQEQGDVAGRSTARVWLEDDTTLVLLITAADTAALRAALNSWLRLINVADEVLDLVQGEKS
ncbi:hypothetical protein ABH15_12905 [Methanoculleus taiwanensis]|uniref:KEOPS complex Pcc1-like subunit n=1 Tax=Methanoculleus taiwanensis TaxID=1550565 RepID=A0A498GVU5_9EURY|nr:KEOPS complex subunit Pcc1 [Methanoculleus taiwanensis]RXE55119.1 hypothetical protein ABH15_12905 [Methanoculleus taiwanensis]